MEKQSAYLVLRKMSSILDLHLIKLNLNYTKPM